MARNSITLQNIIETDVQDNDILGQLCFAAPNEAGGTNAVAIVASIFARSEEQFESGANATELVFVTSDAESSTPTGSNGDMTLSSAGLLTLVGGINVSGGTIAGTIATATQNSITTMTGLVTVGALNTGSITSGFGAIDNGSSNITTTGTLDISGGTLTLAANQISGDKVEGGTIAAITITALTTAGITATANIDIGGYDLRAATVTADGLTSGRVVLAGTNGVLSDDADLTFDGSTLTTNSGIVRKVVTKVDADYTMTASDHIVLVDAAADGSDITLPSASPANIGQEYTIKKIDSGAGVVNIVPASTGGYGPDDIDEYDTKYVLFLQHDSVTFVCGLGDDTAAEEQWWITSEKVRPHSAAIYDDASTQPTINTSAALIHFDEDWWAHGCTTTSAGADGFITIKRAGDYLVRASLGLNDLADGTIATINLYKKASGGSSSQTLATVNSDNMKMITNNQSAATNFDMGLQIVAIVPFVLDDQVAIGAKVSTGTSTILQTDGQRPFLQVVEVTK